MKCPYCQEENIQVISELVERERKDFLPGERATMLFAAIGFILSSILIVIGIRAINVFSSSVAITLETLSGPFFLSLGIFVLIKSYKALHKFDFLRTFIPFKYQTNTKAVCMHCGKTWYIEKDVHETPNNDSPEM